MGGKNKPKPSVRLMCFNEVEPSIESGCPQPGFPFADFEAGGNRTGYFDKSEI